MQTTRQPIGMGTMMRIAIAATVALVLVPTPARSQHQPAARTFRPLVPETPRAEGADAVRSPTSAQRRPTLSGTAVWTVRGSLVGALIGAITGYAVGLPLEEDDALLSPSFVTGFVGSCAGFTVGGAWGARHATTVDGDGPPFGGVLGASLAGAVAGYFLQSQLRSVAPGAASPVATLGVIIGTHTVITSSGALLLARR